MGLADMGAFESETLYRMGVEMARYWVIEHSLRAGHLPTNRTMFVYPNEPEASLDWGNPPLPAQGNDAPLRGKRIRITLEIEDNPSN